MDVEKRVLLCTAGRFSDWCSHCGKQYGFSSKKLKLLYDPAIPPLGTYPKKPNTLIQKNIYTPMFITALFTIVKVWKQPKCPPIDQWIKKLLHIYTMEYYSATKKNGFLPFATAWMNLRGYYAK